MNRGCQAASKGPVRGSSCATRKSALHSLCNGNVSLRLRHVASLRTRTLFSCASSSHASLCDAISEAAATLQPQLSLQQASLVLITSNAAMPLDNTSLTQQLQQLFPHAQLVGAISPPASASMPPIDQLPVEGSANGEQDRSPSTQVLACALKDARVRTFYADAPTLPELPDLEALMVQKQHPHMLLFATASFPLSQQLSVLDAAFPSGTKAGAVLDDQAMLLVGDGERVEAHARGAAGVAFLDGVHVDCVVSHGARQMAKVAVTDRSGGRINKLANSSAASVVDQVERLGGKLLFALTSPSVTQPVIQQPTYEADGAISVEASCGDLVLGSDDADAVLLRPDAAGADEDLTICMSRYAEALRTQTVLDEQELTTSVDSAAASSDGGAAATRERLSHAAAASLGAAIVVTSHERALGAFFGRPGHEASAIRRCLLRPSLPIATVTSRLQIGSLPPAPKRERTRTLVHASSCVAVLLRAARARNAAAPTLLCDGGSERKRFGGVLSDAPQMLIQALGADDAEAALTVETDASNGSADQSVPLAIVGTFLFPGATASFHIFEPRYRLLLQRAQKYGTPLAVGADTTLGTTAEIIEYRELLDGRLEVNLRGRRRFLASGQWVLPGSFGLWMVNPTYFDDDSNGEASDLAQTEVHAKMADLAKTNLSIFARVCEHHAWPIDKLAGPTPSETDPAAVSMWMAAAMPAELERKRSWMLSQDVVERLRSQGEWLAWAVAQNAAKPQK